MIETPALIAINGMWAGLGNRMRFTLSAQAVAAAEGRNFYYSWPVGERFGPQLTDLWDFRQTRLEPSSVRHEFTEKDDLMQLRDRDTWAIRSDSVIRGDGSEQSWEELFRGLVPTLSVRRRLARTKLQLRGRPYVGVQIRASEKSHELTLEASPVSWFIDRMHDMLREEPRTLFFLSCDTPEAQQEVLASVRRVVALPMEQGYNTVGSVRKSVADLYLLARSRYLLGPHWSSFVHLAWALSDRRQPLETSRGFRPAGHPVKDER